MGFYDTEPCGCCGGRVPANRSWPKPACTPSCWLALKPNQRRRFAAGSGPEQAPCLACQDRIGERSLSRVAPAPARQKLAADHRDWLAPQAATTRGAA